MTLQCFFVLSTGKVFSIASPYSFTHRITLLWFTFNIAPIRRKPSPFKYKTQASNFIMGGFFPWYGWVKLHLHSLHLYRCFFRTIPFLTNRLLLHFGHSIWQIYNIYLRGNPLSFFGCTTIFRLAKFRLAWA